MKSTVISFFIYALSWSSICAQDSLSVWDKAFINRCDSILVSHFRLIDSFTTDTTTLNTYNFSKDSIPHVSDATIKQRIHELDKQSPFDFINNDVSLAMIKVYINRRYRLTSRMLGLSQLYFPLFEEKLIAYHLPLELKYLPIVESALKPYAVSHSGAGGLWQFMPATGRGYGLDVSSYIDERNDPYLATEAACKYLSKLYAIYGDWSLCLAAYNAGQGTVSKAIRRSGGKTDYWSIRSYLPKETQNYVPAFIAVNYVMNYAAEHNIYPRVPQFFHYEMDTIIVKQRVDMGVVEEWTGYNRAALGYLNSTYLTEIVPADSLRPLALKMPIDVIGKFIEHEDSIYKYSSLAYKYWVADHQPARKQVIHIVKYGETLADITKKYKCTEQDIKAWNIMTRIKLRKGKKLIVFQLVDPSKKPVNYAKEKHIVTASKSTSNKKSTTASGSKYHTVRKGDTLWDIAKKYNRTVDELKQKNSHLDLSTLHTGTKLKI